jgi:ABC-type molybdate transport system substrate-binding protein
MKIKGRGQGFSSEVERSQSVCKALASVPNTIMSKLEMKKSKRGTQNIILAVLCPTMTWDNASYTHSEV